jgi:DNA-binding transcriptional MocR family regulator
LQITGATAASITQSVRDLIERGALPPGTALPAIRTLATQLGTNRNTVAAAYRQLGAAGFVEARRRAGTVVVGPPDPAGEGQTANPTAVNLAHGNPDPALLPDLESRISQGYQPTLYGAPAVSAELEAVGQRLLTPDVHGDHRILATGGAVDAMERLLATHLTRGDAVAVEDPCFVSSIGLLHVHGLRTRPVPVDHDGARPEALADALAAGVRAVIVTPRAHNPTGASLTVARARELRRVLSPHPDVLIIEDDHFSQVSSQRYRRVTPTTAQRWALIRSVSKFLGPDLRVAIVAADPTTAARVEDRLGAATTWVSHLLQHLTASLLDDPDTQRTLDSARTAYQQRSHLLTDALRDAGLDVQRHSDGLNVWIPLPADEHDVVQRLAQLGWAARRGADFAVGDRPPNAIRVTTSTLMPHQTHGFVNDLNRTLHRT